MDLEKKIKIRRSKEKKDDLQWASMVFMYIIYIIYTLGLCIFFVMYIDNWYL